MSERFDLIGFHIDAHNMWLQIGVETGLIGILIVLVAFVLLVKSIFVAFHTCVNAIHRQRLITYSVIGISILVYNQVDFSFASINYLLAISSLLVLAMIVTMTPESEFVMISRIKIFPIIIIALGIFSYLFITLDLKLESVRDGLNAVQDGDWKQARDYFCEENEHYSIEGLYSFNCSLANSMLSYLSDDREVSTSALTAQKRGLESDPSWGINWVNLSVLQWENGENQEAIENLKKESINFASNSHSPYPAIHLKLWMDGRTKWIRSGSNRII